MGRQDEFTQERLKKIKELREKGINPYPYKYSPTSNSKLINQKHSALKAEEYSKDNVKIAGRVMTRRDLGKIAFGTLHDGYGKIQVVLQDQETPTEAFTLFNKYIDSGDFIGAEGIVFRTKRGELSILVKKIELLSKSIMPLPDKWHGLEDKEERYRKRYLDLLMSPEVKEVFNKREKILDAIREFLKAREFHEVETPYLQTVYGGAAARPFTTHLNALNIPLFLAISPELYLKRLIVGGFERVFTIARNFRNEGIDKSHNPEFTMMEIYQAYADYNDMMELTEDLFEHVAKKVNGSTKVTIQGKEIDFKKPWKRMTMLQAIKEFAKIDADRMDEKELAEFMRDNKVEPKGNSWGWRVQAIFEHFCEDKLEQPTFIIDHPVETTPLCKLHRSGDKRLIERFEPFCLGMELANAYSELNDPVLQRKMLEDQQALLSAGEQEANPFDEDFVNAIEVGLPPTGGLGIGIDRMIILLTGQESIRDVILFPFMKPEKKVSGELAKDMSVQVNKTEKARHSDLPKDIPVGGKVSRKEALALLKEYVKSESLQNHCLAVEAAMRAYARKFKADEELWGVCGLLHDFDYEKYPEKHTIEGTSILIDKKYPKEIIHAILSHYTSFTGVPRVTPMEKTLFAVDEISGLITALSKVRADKFEGMSPESVEKALKKKEFAKNVSREDVEEGIKELGVNRTEHFALIIQALKEMQSGATTPAAEKKAPKKADDKVKKKK